MKHTIETGCAAWGLPIEGEALDRMEAFAQLLVEKNKVMNLTAITDPIQIGKRHMLDCLYLMKCHDLEGRRIIDIGCGPGFPTMPLLCYNPDLNITAMDSTAKRIAFVEACCQALGLSLTALAARAEEQARNVDYFQGFDVVVSRAVAPMNVLAELCLPYARVGGVFLAQKSAGPETETELWAAQHAIAVLGGKIECCYPYQIEGLEREHQVIKICKTADTPPAYPRRYAKITAKPL